MHQTGHLGLSMALFAPVGYWLAAWGYPALALVAGATMVSLSTLPDVDLRLPGVPHRGPTHSLLFAACVGGAFASLAARLQSVLTFGAPAGLSMPEFGFLLGFGSVLAHLAGDVITPMGVNFLWPYPRRWSLNVTPSKNPAWNAGLLVLGVVSVGVSLGFAFGPL